MPKPGVYVTPAEQPNAFATGRNPKHAAIAVTAGIQRALAARELEGVLAHEMAHIKNRDILIASIAAMVAGAISAIANFLQFSLFFGGDDDNPLGLIGTLATIILAPIAAMIIQLAVSRQREYVADATGAELPRRPATRWPTPWRRSTARAEAIPMRVNPAAEPLYIVNPLARQRARRRRRQAVLDPPPDGGARRAPPPHGRREQPADPDLLTTLCPGRGPAARPDGVGQHKRLIEYVARQLKAGAGSSEVLTTRTSNRSTPVDRRRCWRSPRWSRRPARGAHAMRRQLEAALAPRVSGGRRGGCGGATIGSSTGSDRRRTPAGGVESPRQPPSATVEGAACASSSFRTRPSSCSRRGSSSSRSASPCGSSGAARPG